MPGPAMQNENVSGKAHRLIDNVKHEVHTNMAFKLAFVGVSIMFMGMLINSIAHVFVMKSAVSSAFIVLNIVGFIIYFASLAMTLYVNYCITHGKCETLSLAHGILVLVAGIMYVLFAVMQTIVLRRGTLTVNHAATLVGKRV